MELEDYSIYKIDNWKKDKKKASITRMLEQLSKDKNLTDKQKIKKLCDICFELVNHSNAVETGRDLIYYQYNNLKLEILNSKESISILKIKEILFHPQFSPEYSFGIRDVFDKKRTKDYMEKSKFY